MSHSRCLRAPAAARTLLALAAISSAGCYDFHLEGPEDAPSPPLPRTASVTVEYQQPSQCTDVASRCGSAVVFYGSWMRPGEELLLHPVPGRFLWIGTLAGVPVNFPPQGRPHLVRVFDPYLGGAPTRGFTGRRLTLGGQPLTRIESFGNLDEHAQVYVDDNGFGHNPF